MDKQKCSRCTSEEYIPTYQSLIIKESSSQSGVRYELCYSCWKFGRKLLYDKDNYFNSQPKPDESNFGGIVIEGASLSQRKITSIGKVLLEEWLHARCSKEKGLEDL